MSHIPGGPGRRSSVSLTLVGLALPLVACGGKPAAVAVPERQVTEAEYEAAPKLPLEAAGTLCGPDARPCETGRQVSAAPGLNGELLIWEYGGPIHRYDSNGVRRANLGGVGEGDGEYQLVVTAGPSPGGVSLFDVSQVRLIQYDSSGVFRDSRQVQVSQATRQVVLWQGRIVAFNVQSQAKGGGSVFRAVAVDGASGGDTLASHTLPNYVSRWGRMQELPGLFEAQPVWNLGPLGEVLFTAGLSYEIWGYHEGRAVRRLVVDHLPRAVEPEETAREADAMRRRVAETLRSAVDAAVQRVAERHPSITQLFSMPGGGILVRESPDAAGDSVRWSRFDRDWKISGYFLTAESARVLLIEPERMLLQEQLEGGVKLQWYVVP